MKKILNIFLVIILIIAIILFGLVIYAKFIYKPVDKPDEGIKEEVNKKEVLKEIATSMEDNFLTNYYFQDKDLLVSSDATKLIIKIADKDYNFNYQDDYLVLTSTNLEEKEEIIKITQILMDVLGQKNGFSQGEFIYTINQVFKGYDVANISYFEDGSSLEIKINISQKIEPIVIERLANLDNNYEIIYKYFELIDVTKKDYVILNNDHILSDIELSHNSTYNILKVSLKDEYLSDLKKEFKITTKLYSENNNIISQNTYEYQLTDTKITNIRISHMLKNKDDYANIKYISIEVE